MIAPKNPSWAPLISSFDQALRALHTIDSPEKTALLMRAVRPALARMYVLPDAPAPLPWGRYLLHQDPAGRYNLQLDLFSPGYTGSIHAHGTWGIFWVLQGGLEAWDYSVEPLDGGSRDLVARARGQAPGTALCDTRDVRVRVARAGWVGAGGGQSFCPPVSDWHRVGTHASGPQTVSIHAYGAGFDMDIGVGIDPEGTPRAYRRGPLGALEQVASALGCASPATSSLQDRVQASGQSDFLPQSETSSK